MKEGKLIRDKIPEIIKGSSRTPIFHIANDDEYREKLLKKLQEEVDEFINSNDASELADILEVVHAIAKNISVTIEELEKLRREKMQKNGSFQKRVILDDVKQ